MPTRVNIPPNFRRQIKRLQRKYPSVTEELRDLVLALETDQRPGELVPNVGYDGVFKIRLRNRSARRGRRGGFRVVYYEQVSDLVFLLLIYSKSEIENIPSVDIRRVLEAVVWKRNS